MDNSTIPTRECSKCNRTLPATLEYFHKSKACKYGVYTICRECRLIPGGRVEKARATTRTCKICKQTFPATDEFFYRHITTKDGSNRNHLHTMCKTCEKKSIAEAARQRRADNPEQHEQEKQWHKDYYASNPERREAAIQRSQKWYDDNREYASERKKIYAHINRDNPRQIAARRRAEARGKANGTTATIRHRRRARIRNLVNDLTVEQWQRCLDYFGHRCAVCGKPRGLWHTLAQDHWKPLSKGGGTTAKNIVPLCHAGKDGRDGCNNTKTNLDPVIWLQRYFPKQAQKILKRIQDYFDSLL